MNMQWRQSWGTEGDVAPQILKWGIEEREGSGRERKGSGNWEAAITPGFKTG